jgi:trk system potassium uptake protein TrkH
MESLRDWLNKKSAQVTNLLFVLTLMIITVQLTSDLFQQNEMYFVQDLLTAIIVLFSILSFALSIYYVQTASYAFIRFVRLIFFLLCLVNVIIQLSLAIGMESGQASMTNLGLFLTLILGFIAISSKIASLGNSDIHPSLLFVLTFAFLILFGALGLMLPASTVNGIGFTDALFTATSAVTVTGLAVLDTGKDFTFFGQVIIALLLQLGGLGILTVTNLFALIFKPSSSFRNRMMVSDMIKEAQSNRTFSTLFKIILFTGLVELVGAFFIFLSIYGQPDVTHEPIFFSIFHAISAFCNGGFSLLSNNLYEESIRFNYNLQLAISWLIITGGIGYSVMINHWAIFKNIASKVMQPLTGPRPNVLVRTSINTRIIAFTTFILLFAGTGLFFVSEYNNTLAEHSLWGKFVVSFFNATTPRTAGFNNINMAELGIPAFMLIMALMWVGASPGSTGGGIKTTTFAVALLNLWNQIKGRERLIIRLKEIPGSTINQVNAVILLSIFAISFGTFLLAFLEKDILFKDLLFESISAFSTVGLSIGITPALTEGSQYVLIGLMFLGRVSFLTFLIGLFNNLDSGDPACSAYYGKENVIIN